MKPSPVSVIASCLLSVGLLSLGMPTAVAGEVYQWKDAKGVTQYSSTPPPKGVYKVRTINNAGAANAAVATTATSAEDPQCAQARTNVAALQGKGAVQLDADGDGKPDKTLSDSERTSQLALAQAVIAANDCKTTATASVQK